MASRFPFACPNAFTAVLRAVSGALGEDSGAFVDGGTLRVRFGFAFATEVPLSTITATPYDGRVISRGVHGWRGDWLVNTTGSDLVELTFRPTQKARVLGVPVRLARLRLTPEDPEALLAALA